MHPERVPECGATGFPRGPVFVFASTACFTPRPRQAAGCTALASPRNHSSSFALASVGWHLDPLLSQLAFMFLLFFLSPFGTGSVVPTGVVETPGGRALDTPVQWTSRLGIANWHFAAAHDTWPTCDLSTDGAVRANYARFGFRSKCLFPSHAMHCSDSAPSYSEFGSVACQRCVQAERERQRKSA